ncbi:MAG: PadR family transcriptional regulator [Ilumatobacteraceae bacterium]
MQESQLRKGVLDLAVMLVLHRGESYGYELNQSLAAAGFADLGDATIYGTLRRMEHAGWLRSRLVASSDGPARKYHALTPDGERQMQETMERWNDLVAAMQSLSKDPK